MASSRVRAQARAADRIGRRRRFKALVDLIRRDAGVGDDEYAWRSREWLVPNSLEVIVRDLLERRIRVPKLRGQREADTKSEALRRLRSRLSKDRPPAIATLEKCNMPRVPRDVAVYRDVEWPFAAYLLVNHTHKVVIRVMFAYWMEDIDENLSHYIREQTLKVGEAKKDLEA